MCAFQTIAAAVFGAITGAGPVGNLDLSVIGPCDRNYVGQGIVVNVNQKKEAEQTTIPGPLKIGELRTADYIVKFKNNLNRNVSVCIRADGWDRKKFKVEFFYEHPWGRKQLPAGQFHNLTDDVLNCEKKWPFIKKCPLEDIPAKGTNSGVGLVVKVSLLPNAKVADGETGRVWIIGDDLGGTGLDNVFLSFVVKK